MPQPLEFEGTWEEIISHAKDLAGRKVRLTVLTPDTATENNASDDAAESSNTF